MIHRRGTLIALLASLLAPASAYAEVPRTGDVLSPRDGAELLEAADLASAAARDQGGPFLTIQLASASYEVSRPVVLSSPSAIALVGPEVGEATITNVSGTPGTLLRVSSQTHVGRTRADHKPRISSVAFRVTGDVPDNMAFPLIELQSGGSATELDVLVPATAPKVTAVRMVPALGGFQGFFTHPVLMNSRVESAATQAPALRLSPGAEIDGLEIEGGVPAVEIAEDVTDATPDLVTIARTSITAGAAPVPALVRVRAAGILLRLNLISSILDAGDHAVPLLDLAGGTSAGGKLGADLFTNTFTGPAGSTAIAVAPGAEAQRSTVGIRGLLSLGSETTVKCSPGGATKPDVKIVGIYREGANAPGTACDLTETIRRTGDLNLANRDEGDLRPTFRSEPLLDALAVPTSIDLFGGIDRLNGNDVYDDFNFLDRTIERRDGAPANPQGSQGLTDIGAYEYGWTAPLAVALDWGQIGNRGLVGLYGDGFDRDPGESAGLQFRWTFPDGSHSDEQFPTYRFTEAEPSGTVRLEVTDVTGLMVYETASVRGWFALDEPATDDPDYEPKIPEDEEDGPIDNSLIDPNLIDPDTLVPTTPVTQSTPDTKPKPTTPASTPKPTPPVAKPTAPTLSDVTVVDGRLKAKTTTPTGYGAARANEAELAFTLSRKVAVTLTLEQIGKAGAAVAIPEATMKLRQRSGAQRLRISARLGKARLKRGLYRVTLSVRGTASPSAVERRSVLLRVTR